MNYRRESKKRRKREWEGGKETDREGDSLKDSLSGIFIYKSRVLFINLILLHILLIEFSYTIRDARNDNNNNLYYDVSRSEGRLILM